MKLHRVLPDIPLNKYTVKILILFLIFTDEAQRGFPGGSAGKESTCNAGDLASIPGLGRSPGEGKGNPFQYSCWKIPWTEGPGGCKESDTTERLN